MMIEFNKLDREYKRYEKEYKEAALRVLESGWYTLGIELHRFEKLFADFCGVKHCVGVNSGLDALILAFKALDVKEGDEVIVPANTYIASVIGITQNGATPVFVEPDEFYNLDTEKLEEAITEKTKAILVVHLYGQAANMEKISKIAKKNHLFLIEDCAQSHGACYDGKITGAFSDVGCFSFFPTKNLGAFGDGGAIVTDNSVLAEKISMYRNYGSRIKYYHEIDGYNSRLDEIQAALLSVKLSHMKELNRERINIANRYLSEIKNEKIELPKVRKKAEHVYHLFVVKTRDREHLQKYLLEKDIKTQIHYPIPPHLSECYKHLGYKRGSLPITEGLANEILSLPLYYGMTEEEQEYVIEALNNY